MPTDFPATVTINEEGPREGFQIEPGPISTADKVAFVEALAGTGVRKIDCVSFVDPRRVPGMADADAVATGIHRVPGIRYTGLWLNERGLDRALALPLDTVGAIRVTASETFSTNNTGKGIVATQDEQRRWLERYVAAGIPVESGYVMTAFGCNFEGEVPVATVIDMVAFILELVDGAGLPRPRVFLADTVGHAAPSAIERVVGAVRDRWPDLPLGLHLHDTRGLGVANVHAALALGVDHFDAACAGLGGCPFAGHAGAAGNVCTEEVVFLCEELGIDTGIDLERMIDCARMAEEIVGHRLPGKLTRGGSLRAIRGGQVAA
ncbi:Hydroxymethylglutaryl-CoA lyase YngG [Baekduia alba]|uniref:hydroxymethylglutaryl-CoA lyase n=1 Tax=Baekduia alba TaxID=2997333 RepID=UPI002340C01E|nr:hydroxymethylglutaryl-CoA lyase [Baekduia alba]WCB95374.1 Hydroxymethylglutaryl-CoA lyase YngG [Baekduia alba]